MKHYHILRRALCVLLVASVIVLAAVPAFAAAYPIMRIMCVQNSSKRTVDVTVEISSSAAAIGSGMFMLDYDTSVLAASSSSVVAAGKAISTKVYSDTSKGYIGMDWYFSPQLAAGSAYSAVAKVSFSVKSGKTASSSSVRLCTDTDYLKSANGYQNYGGALLCSGSTTYCSAKGTLSVEITSNAAGGAKYTRLGGDSRYETAVLIAKNGWSGGASNVVLASGESFADALAGVPLAAKLNAPILLVSGKTVNGQVMGEIKALGAKNIYILGGASSVSSEIQSQLAKSYKIERISGSSRFATAVAIAKKLDTLRSGKPTELFLAYGYNYPDALAVSSAAGVSACPILYVPAKGDIDSATAAYIKGCGCTKATVLGGTSTVADSVVSSAKRSGIKNCTRISGSDRYETALAICKQYKSILSGGELLVATGTSFPDALAGGALAAKKKSPVLLVGKNNPSAAMRSYVKSLNPSMVYALGGTGSVPQSAMDSLMG